MVKCFTVALFMLGVSEQYSDAFHQVLLCTLGPIGLTIDDHASIQGVRNTVLNLHYEFLKSSFKQNLPSDG